MPRTRPCTPQTRRGRLRKATEFLDAANHLRGSEADEPADAYVSLCVLAGIAASDVVCCARLGEHASDENHSAAIALLGKANKEVAKHLRTLLSMKAKASYGDDPPSADECKRAGRAAEALVEAARRAHGTAGG
jgi:hypothetical protein